MFLNSGDQDYEYYDELENRMTKRPNRRRKERRKERRSWEDMETAGLLPDDVTTDRRRGSRRLNDKERLEKKIAKQVHQRQRINDKTKFQS